MVYSHFFNCGMWDTSSYELNLRAVSKSCAINYTCNDGFRRGLRYLTEWLRVIRFVHDMMCAVLLLPHSTVGSTCVQVG